MIALARADLRRFRTAARRCIRPGSLRDRSLPMRLAAEGETVTISAHLLDVVIALRVPAAEPSTGSVVLPLADLEGVEGPGPTPVVIETLGQDKLSVRWTDGSVPRSKELDRLESTVKWPAEPKRLIALPPNFLLALHEAGRTAEREAGKYVTNRIQVRGKLGQLIATDGKQALLQGGFKFPFTEDLLIPAIPVFGTKEVGGEQAVSVGLVDDWLYLVIGPWRFWLSIDREGRYPDIGSAIPKAPGTRVAFAEEDAQKVLETLPSLPSDKTEPETVTLDLGRPVAIRAREGDKGQIVEVPLRQSECHGPEARVLLNRTHLGRALALGFREFRCSSPERPLVATDDSRTYVSATLDPKDAVPPGREASRPAEPVQVPVNPSRPPIDSPESNRRSPMPVRESSIPERNGQHPDTANGEMLDPLAEAEALRSLLADAASRSVRLVTALKQFRKERRALASAFSSLRQLNLGH